MSNLILSRCGGQGVGFADEDSGKASGLTVLRVTGGDVKLHFSGCDPVSLRIGQSLNHPFLELQIRLGGIQQRTAKLCFDAPKNVKILRTELVRASA